MHTQPLAANTELLGVILATTSTALMHNLNLRGGPWTAGIEADAFYDVHSTPGQRQQKLRESDEYKNNITHRNRLIYCDPRFVYLVTGKVWASVPLFLLQAR